MSEHRCRFCGEVWNMLVGDFGPMHENECELKYLRGRIAAINRMELAAGREDVSWEEGWNAAVEQAKYAANWNPFLEDSANGR